MLLLTGVSSIFDKMLMNTSGGLLQKARNCAYNVTNSFFLKTEAKAGKNLKQYFVTELRPFPSSKVRYAASPVVEQYEIVLQAQQDNIETGLS